MAKVAGTAREARLVSLLEDNVRTELQVTNGMLELGLSEATIERLMEGVTSGLLYAFKVDWSPDWVKPGQVHEWEEGGAFFARCSVCLLDSPRADSRAAAEAWARQHEATH
jgi:hypothetical protein